MLSNYSKWFSSAITFCQCVCIISAAVTLPPIIFDNKINKILEYHNLYRTCHGVPHLILDLTLTNEAQKAVEEIANSKIRNNLKTNRKYGENLFTLQWPHTLPDLLSDTMAVKRNFNPVDVWYDELRFYRKDINAYQQPSEHFTQIIWKNTKKIGCGISQNNQHEVFVLCYYYPPGNMNGEFADNVQTIKKTNLSSVALKSRCIYSDTDSSNDYRESENLIISSNEDKDSKSLNYPNKKAACNDSITNNTITCPPISTSTVPCTMPSTTCTMPSTTCKTTIVPCNSTNTKDEAKEFQKIYFYLTLILALLSGILSVLTADFIYKLCFCFRQNPTKNRCSPQRSQSMINPCSSTAYPPQRCLNPPISSVATFKGSSPPSSRPSTPQNLSTKSMFSSRN